MPPPTGPRRPAPARPDPASTGPGASPGPQTEPRGGPLPGCLPGLLPGLLLGLLLGVAGVLAAAGCGERASDGSDGGARGGAAPGAGAREVSERRGPATAEDVALWTGQLERRGRRWEAFPDPPGSGPLHVQRFAVGFESYQAELRLRGRRLTLGISGVDRQVGGGGWLAFAEGALEPGPAASPENPFAGAVARIAWSCLGARLLSGNDGVARLVFDAAGDGFRALYLGYGEPEVWTVSYARRVGPGGPVPPGTVKGQIPSTPELPPLDPERVYRRRVQVLSTEGARVPYALVQLKGLPGTRVVADAEGVAEVVFRGRYAPRAQVFAAGAAGFRNGESIVFADEWPPAGAAREAPTLRVELAPMPLSDHPGYRFRHPAPDADPDDLMACGTCHKWHFDQWVGSRHARAGANGHVAYERDLMLAAAPEAPDDCRACHQPVDALERPQGEFGARGSRLAVTCDLCHKVHAVLDLRASGVEGALQVLRPDPAVSLRPGGIHHVFGPLPDVTFAYMGAGWNGLFQSSHLCAGCHQGGGRWREGAPPKLDTFEEWRRWAAGVPESAARSCQDCHMPSATTVDVEGRPVHQIAWDGLHRQPGAVHEHRFEGSGAAFAERALRVDVTTERRDGRLLAAVAVTNTGAGHRVPTGTWTKHVLVGVWARQGARWLRQVDGERAVLQRDPAPDEPLAAGDWRNPGGFVLGVRARDEASAALRQPSLWEAWAPDDLVDERLLPGATRTARLAFAAEGAEPVEIVVRLVHRRGELGAGPAHAPWTPALYDEPAEVLWSEVRAAETPAPGAPR